MICSQQTALSCSYCNRATQDGYKMCSHCRQRSARNKARRKPEGRCPQCNQIKEPGKKCTEACREHRKQIYQARAIRLKEAGLCVGCARSPHALPSMYCSSCLEKSSINACLNRKKIKQEVLDHYGNCCNCCGEADFKSLTVDHIHGNGAQHRKEISGKNQYKAAVSMCHWLKKNNYPPGFQILCSQCNFLKGTSKECPHVQERATMFAALSRIPLTY